MIKKKQYKLLILILFLVIIISILAYIFRPQKNDDINIEFYNVNEKTADSILENLSTKQKIEQIIINGKTKITNANYNLAGYKIITEKYDNYSKILHKAIKNAKISPIIYNNFPLFLPTFVQNQYPSIGIHNLQTISDTALIHEIIRESINLNIKLKTNFFELDFLNNIVDSSITDTNVIKSYTNLALKYATIFKKNKLIFSAPTIPYSTDSLRAKFVEHLYSKLSEKGLNSILIKNRQDLKNNFVLNFKGIIYSNGVIFSNKENFFKSKIDITIINNEDSIKNLVDELTKIANSKRKYKKLLNAKVKKVLLAKTWLSTNNINTNKYDTCSGNISEHNFDILFQKVLKKSIILINNKKNFLPIINTNTKFETLFISKNNNYNSLKQNLLRYTNVSINHQKQPTFGKGKKPEKYKNKNIIVYINNIKLTPNFINLLLQLDSLNNLIVINVQNKENLNLLKNLNNLIFCLHNSDLTQKYLAQAIFGGIKISGKIPFNINNMIKFGQGIATAKTRLSYDTPEIVGMSSKKLQKIDSIAENAINAHIFPGCQVFAAKNGVVIWEKSYGYTDYSKSTKVDNNTIYDIASVTKIMATTIAAMKMYDNGKLKLNTKLEKYFNNTNINYNKLKKDTTEKNYIVKIDTLNTMHEPDWKKIVENTDTTWLNDSVIISTDTIKFDVAPKNNIFKTTPEELLTHKSGIQPAMPILELMLISNKNINRIKDYYAKKNNDTTPDTLNYKQKWNYYYNTTYKKDSAEVKVASNMYLKNQFFDTLWENTKLLRVWHKKVYVYSDVNMILLQITIDSINNYSISKYLTKYFYKPLRLKHIAFNPREKFNRQNIAPTEKDNYWRHQVIQGYVHDPSAAIMGGIAGNAGIFANANNLGIISQMLLNGGRYGRKNFITKNTVNKFTETQPESHRGLGFDKWSKRQIIAPNASKNTFGHTGFTGTCVWIDPDNEIIFVFLSNRVHPSAKNWKINKYKIRQKIHQTIYEAKNASEVSP